MLTSRAGRAGRAAGGSRRPLSSGIKYTKTMRKKRHADGAGPPAVSSRACRRRGVKSDTPPAPDPPQSAARAHAQRARKHVVKYSVCGARGRQGQHKRRTPSAAQRGTRRSPAAAASAAAASRVQRALIRASSARTLPARRTPSSAALAAAQSRLALRLWGPPASPLSPPPSPLAHAAAAPAWAPHPRRPGPVARRRARAADCGGSGAGGVALFTPRRRRARLLTAGRRTPRSQRRPAPAQGPPPSGPDAAPLPAVGARHTPRGTRHTRR